MRMHDQKGGENQSEKEEKTPKTEGRKRNQLKSRREGKAQKNHECTTIDSLISGLNAASSAYDLAFCNSDQG